MSEGLIRALGKRSRKGILAPRRPAGEPPSDRTRFREMGESVTQVDDEHAHWIARIGRRQQGVGVVLSVRRAHTSRREGGSRSL